MAGISFVHEIESSEHLTSIKATCGLVKLSTECNEVEHLSTISEFQDNKVYFLRPFLRVLLLSLSMIDEINDVRVTQLFEHCELCSHQLFKV